MLEKEVLDIDERPTGREPSTLERRRKQEQLDEGRLRQEEQMRRMRHGLV